MATLGYPFIEWVAPDYTEQVGVRRSLGVNGAGGWENSLEPSASGFLADGWGLPVLAGANGRWILIADDFQRSGNPAVLINDSPNLDPAEWQAPSHLISAAFCTDIYGGMGSGLHATFRRLSFGRLTGVTYPNAGGATADVSAGGDNATARLKFIPQSGHSAGGRWWLMGARDTLLYSDTNGDSWSNSLADHTAAEAAMHPFLNWRRTYADARGGNIAGGFRYTFPKVMDIAADPTNSGRLMAVGVTRMGLAGITNRLAVYATSDDWGDTWSAVGQLPLGLERIEDYDASLNPNAGVDHVATASWIFPRVVV